jgi:hypothetical protein
MELIRSVDIDDGEKTRLISVYAGDLSRIPSGSAVDLLVVSAFPNSYAPVPGTLIGALHQAGLSVRDLAADKDQDLRAISGFWISKPLAEAYPAMHIGRIACFEPLVLGQPPQIVGELFRGLFPFLDDERDCVVAMPLLSAGNQRWPAEAIFGPLAEAAAHWLARGLPIAELRIVEINEDRAHAVARQLEQFHDGRFAAGTIPAPPQEPPVPDNRTIIPPFPPHTIDSPRQPDAPALGKGPASPADGPLPGGPAEPAPRPQPGPSTRPTAGDDGGFDVFLSYAEEDKDAAECLANFLRSEIAGIRIFDYRLSIDIGKSWQQEIDDAIESCKKIVALMSPNYFASPECKEELMIARLRNKRSNFEVFFPLYWKDAGRALAMWIQAVTYSDCREGDPAKLADITKRLAQRLRPGRRL